MDLSRFARVPQIGRGTHFLVQKADNFLGQGHQFVRIWFPGGEFAEFLPSFHFFFHIVLLRFACQFAKDEVFASAVQRLAPPSSSGH